MKLHLSANIGLAILRPDDLENILCSCRRLLKLTTTYNLDNNIEEKPRVYHALTSVAESSNADVAENRKHVKTEDVKTMDGIMEGKNVC